MHFMVICTVSTLWSDIDTTVDYSDVGRRQLHYIPIDVIKEAVGSSVTMWGDKKFRFGGTNPLNK